MGPCSEWIELSFRVIRGWVSLNIFWVIGGRGAFDGFGALAVCNAVIAPLSGIVGVMCTESDAR